MERKNAILLLKIESNHLYFGMLVNKLIENTGTSLQELKLNERGRPNYHYLHSTIQISHSMEERNKGFYDKTFGITTKDFCSC